MDAVVIYESLTGNTRRAAEQIVRELRARGAGAVACPVDAVDLQAVADADLVIVGGWTDGLILFGHRPGRAGRMRKRLPQMNGKKAVVFATYAIEAGKVLDKLAALVEGRGAEVLGGMTIRRDRVEAGAADFAERVLADVPV